MSTDKFYVVQKCRSVFYVALKLSNVRPGYEFVLILIFTATDSIEVLQERPLLDLLGHFGGWPVLEGSAWKADNFSWINLVTSLRHFNNDILVMIWVGPDGKDSNDFIVQVQQTQKENLVAAGPRLTFLYFLV